MTNGKSDVGASRGSQTGPVDSSETDVKKAERFWNAAFERLEQHINGDQPTDGENALKQS